MTASCSSPIPWESLVAYWADDLDAKEADRIDEHMMGCTACFEASARVSAVTESLRAMVPLFLSPERLAALRARGLRVVDNPVAIGDTKTAMFPLGADILLHRLGGLDLSEVERASITVTYEETGEVVMQQDPIPFDRGSSEILVACQRHFGEQPRTVVFEVRTRGPSGTEQTARYSVPHVYEAKV